MKKVLAGVVLSFAAVQSGFAHFPMLIHDTPFAEVNQPVQFMYAVGHPYEQEYAPAAKPEKVYVVSPDGSQQDITDQLTEGTYQVDDITAEVWNFEYAPADFGDSIVALNSEPLFGLNQVVNQEYLKVILHASGQSGWDQRTGQPIEIVPLTRPYGMEEGFVFTGQLMQGDQPLAGVDIEIEQFLTHVPRPEDLPPEPMITRVVKTDVNGIFSYTLPNPGWWILAASVDNAGVITIDGNEYTLNGLAALWVHVEEKFIQKFPSTVSNWNQR